MDRVHVFYDETEVVDSSHFEEHGIVLHSLRSHGLYEISPLSHGDFEASDC